MSAIPLLQDLEDQTSIPVDSLSREWDSEKETQILVELVFFINGA